MLNPLLTDSESKKSQQQQQQQQRERSKKLAAHSVDDLGSRSKRPSLKQSIKNIFFRKKSVLLLFRSKQFFKLYMHCT